MQTFYMGNGLSLDESRDVYVHICATATPDWSTKHKNCIAGSYIILKIGDKNVDKKQREDLMEKRRKTK